MGVSARAGDYFGPTSVGTPILGVDGAGNLTPLSIGASADLATTSEIHVPADNTAAVLTFAAQTNFAHVISEMTWSYFGSGTIATGNLKIADGSDTIFDMDITAKGQDQLVFPNGRRGHSGRAMTVTLAAGGAANIQGKLSASHYMTYIVAGGQIDFNDEMNSGLLPLFF